MAEILEFIRENHGPWALILVGVAAALEYMLPPLPADTIVLAGSLLVVAGAWSFPAVLTVVVAGGFAGSISHYLLGRMLVDERGTLRGGRVVERLVGAGTLDRFFGAFRKHGIWIIAMNRMFPGIRAAVFLAAGAARLPAFATLALGLVSNVLWSLFILGMGVLIGGNLEKLEQLLSVYKSGALVLGLILVVLFVLHRRRKKRQLQEFPKP